VHAGREVFYTPLPDCVEDREMVLKALEEHGVVELIFNDVESCPVGA